MSVRTEMCSDLVIQLWGKTHGGELSPGHPLLFHMLDAAVPQFVCACKSAALPKRTRAYVERDGGSFCAFGFLRLRLFVLSSVDGRRSKVVSGQQSVANSQLSVGGRRLLVVGIGGWRKDLPPIIIRQQLGCFGIRTGGLFWLNVVHWWLTRTGMRVSGRGGFGTGVSRRNEE